MCRAYVLLSRLEEAHSCLDRAQEIIAMPEEWLGLPAGVYLSEGLLAAVEEKWDKADAAFQRAADTNEENGVLYDQAQVFYEWAVMFQGRSQSGDRERGAELLSRALGIFQRCDAKKDIEKVIARKELLSS